MLARSGKVTVKVTGNPSTAHVASFIADPSTIAATNSDLSTLKATVEDGSGNLIEGLTVYFALKSGSTTLTSLTAVTDQNGIATTSVKGAITGSITVSTVTSAGGLQTVDISLVAGPADASQSILKNNQSSLKGTLPIVLSYILFCTIYQAIRSKFLKGWNLCNQVQTCPI